MLDLAAANDANPRDGERGTVDPGGSELFSWSLGSPEHDTRFAVGVRVVTGPSAAALALTDVAEPCPQEATALSATAAAS